MTISQLTTRRLVMRRWRSSDSEPFAALNADEEVMKYFPRMLAREESDALIERIERNFENAGFGLWAVEIQSSGEFIGFVGLSQPSWQSSFTPCVEIGWRLAKKYWGHGYAPEAALEAMRDGFERLGLAEILSWTATINLNSIRVMEKIGMARNPHEDFDHPLIESDHALCKHVLYRKSNTSSNK